MPHPFALAGLAPWILFSGLLAFTSLVPHPPSPLHLDAGAHPADAEPPPAWGRDVPDPEPTAVVLRVMGTSDEPGHRVGAFLIPGDAVAAAETERVLLLTRTGELVQVEGGESVEVTDEGTAETDPLFRLLRALLREALSLSDPSSGTPPAIPPEAHEEGPEPTLPVRPVRPVGERLVRSLTPRMEWQAEEEAMAYRIHLWEVDGSMISVEAGAATAWTLPPEVALSPGSRYEWAVEPRPGDRIGPRAAFQVASREILDELARELGGLRQRGLDPEGDGRLAAAAIFRSMGFPYDALDFLVALEASGDPWAPEVQDFHRRLVEELTSSDTQGAFFP